MLHNCCRKEAERRHVDQERLHLQDRYFFDPPEFLTMLYKGGPPGEPQPKRHEHWGYFRDDPTSLPQFIAHCSDAREGKMTIASASLFGALHKMLLACKDTVLATKMESFCKTNGVSLTSKHVTYGARKRKLECVASTFNGLGIVVDCDKDVGYRPLGVEAKELWKDLDSIANHGGDTKKLRELINWSSIANDESDFGNSLELGIDLFSSFPRFTKTARKVLSTSYTLLGRDVFCDIITLHCSERTHNPVNMFDEEKKVKDS